MLKVQTVRVLAGFFDWLGQVLLQLGWTFLILIHCFNYFNSTVHSLTSLHTLLIEEHVVTADSDVTCMFSSYIQIYG